MEEKKLNEEEIIDLVNIYNYFCQQLYPYIAPENIDNSKISSIISEQYTIKTDELLSQKEISKYITDKQYLISVLKKFCEFFNFSENDELITYVLPETMSVFAILNIPPKMKKVEVHEYLELINLQYNRLYKRGFYWVLSTTDKETVICVQNSLRTLTFDDMKVKYDLKNKQQIYKLMKDQIDRISYQKESKNLGTGNKKYNNDNKHKNSNGNSDALSWRKGSSEGSSFDYNEKRYKKGYYYNNNNNNNKNYYKRSRFNSDNAVSNNKEYYQKEYKPQGNMNKESEVDFSNIKYPIDIKYKYSFKEIEKYYHKFIGNNNVKVECPFENENKEIFEELVAEKPKIVVSFEELIKATNELDKIKEEEKGKEKEINSNISIPKINPLSNMNKTPLFCKKDENLGSNTIVESINDK